MAQGKITVVRVYAHDDSGTLSGATAQLDVLDDKGNRISTLSPQSSPAQLTTSSCPGRLPSTGSDSAERIGRQIERQSMPPEVRRIVQECTAIIAKEVESVKTLVNEFAQFFKICAGSIVGHTRLER